jgi:nicotinamidase/pyrazinamidase
LLIFFVSDAQNDFILPNGSYHLNGVESIKKNLEKLTSFARKRKIKIIFSADKHFGTADYKEYEMSELEIWGGPFPMHCMNGTSGAKILKEIAPKKPACIENKAYSQAALKKFAKNQEIVIEKQRFSVFSNPNTAKLLKMLKVSKVILYGLQTDYSMRSAALEMRRMGIDIYVVTDSSRGINVKPADSEISIRQMHAAGARMIITEKVLNELPFEQH